ncbi:cytochrome P450 [Streptomyces sp. SP17BM10]|uniref:cytochrome P450 family protein n=1 Tax=Streptomyces sp. SP17BM10 TaxID=3002530 RepID=UPI002E75FCE5|nr:cytochrome P450 [Streptomyces sp. SP17BM10]MEE1782391.1 cytochrome P450 [Streptomyces sp. SP17BM10]
MSTPLQDPSFFRDPYATYAALRGGAAVQKLPGAGPRGGYVVTGYAEARQALADPGLSKDTARFFAGKATGRDVHPAVSRNMLATDPPDHTRLRRLVTKAFTPGAVARLRPYVRGVADALLDPWRPGETVDLVAGLAIPLPVTVICQLLGVPADDRDAVHAWSTDLFAAGDHERTDAASHALADYMTGLVAAKRRSPDDALLSALVAARDGDRGEDGDGDGDRLTEQELVSLAVLLLVAGHETTTAAIGNAVLALLRHPDQLELLRADPGRIEGAVDELLRYDSAVTVATWRWAPEPVRIGGTEVPAGSPVFVSPGAANRDPARFADADRLDLDRPDARAHLAFGHGIHRCLGAPLAQAEVATALRVLLARFPGLRLAEPADHLRWRHSRLVHGLEALPVVL